MSESDPNENREGAYHMLLPELTLTAFDFDALSLREEDIAQLLSPSQHPLDFSPDFQDFADLAEHVLSEQDAAAASERRNSTGEWERELYGQYYRLPLSEGPLTPEDGQLPADSPSQYPLDANDTPVRRARSVVPQTVVSGSGYFRERSYGSQRPDSAGAASDPREDQFRSVPPGTAGSSSDTSLPLSSSSSRGSFQGRRKTEGSRRRAGNVAGTATGQRDAARLQRKRASASRAVAGSDYAGSTFPTTLSPREGPSDGFDPAPFRPLPVSSDEQGSREGSVPASTDGAGYFYDQPRGEPMGSEGEMAAAGPAPGRGRNFVTGTDSETDDGSLRAGRGRSLSGEEDEQTAPPPFRNNLRRTDWLRGTVEGADDNAESGAAVAPTGATWWQQQPPPPQASSSSNVDANYSEHVVDLEGNVRPPLVGQSEERRSVAGGGDDDTTLPAFVAEVVDSESELSEPGASSRASQPVSTSTLTSKDSLAHRVVHLLQPDEAPPDWLVDVDDDEDDEDDDDNGGDLEPGPSGRPQVRSDYPSESTIRREFLSACRRDARIVTFGKRHGQEDSETEAEEVTAAVALGPRFSVGDEMDGVTSRSPDVAGFVSDGGDLVDDRVTSADLDQQRDLSDDHQFGLSSTELTDAEQLQVPTFAAAATVNATRGADTPAGDHHVQRAVSPSVMSVSSVASSKRLEWDSGADIGYGGPRVMYGLSTLERMAIGSSTVFRRMEPEGKSALAKNGNVGSSSATVVPAAPPSSTDAMLLTDEVNEASVESAPVSRHSRSSDRILSVSAAGVVPDATFMVAAHSPESGETYPTNTAHPGSGRMFRHGPTCLGQRSNSMMDLSRHVGSTTESSRPLRIDRKHVSTSDIKGSGGGSSSSGGRLYKLINSWFSSTTSGLSTTSSGGTVVPGRVAVPTTQTPADPQLCSTGIEGSGSRTVQHRLSFHTPASDRLSSTFVDSAPRGGGEITETPIVARPLRRTDTFLTVPVAGKGKVATKSSPPAEVSVPPPVPTRAEQEMRLLAFAEKFVTSLCPSANPARRMKMASRILGDIGALLKVTDSPSSNVSEETKSTNIGESKSSSSRAVTISTGRSPAVHAAGNIKEMALPERRFRPSTASSIPANSKIELLHDSAKANSEPFLTPEVGSNFGQGSEKSGPVSGEESIRLVTNCVSRDLLELSAGHHGSEGGAAELSPRIVSSTTTTTFSISSSATTDYYVLGPTERFPLDRAVTAVSTDGDVRSSTATTVSRRTPDSVATASSGYPLGRPWSENNDAGLSSAYSTRSRQQLPRERQSRRTFRSTGSGTQASDSTSSEVLAIYSTVGSETGASASPESLRLLRELVHRQRRRYLRTLRKEVAWLEKVETILGRKKPRSVSSSLRPATLASNGPRRMISSPKRSGAQPPPVNRPSPVKAMRDFGQSYPTPCPSDSCRLRIGDDGRSSASVVGGGRLPRGSDSSPVRLDYRPIVTVPVLAGGERVSGCPVVVGVRRRASSWRRGRTGSVEPPYRWSETEVTGQGETRLPPKKAVTYFLPYDSVSGSASRVADVREDGVGAGVTQSLQEAFHRQRATLLLRMEQRQRQLKASALKRGKLTGPPAPSSGVVINLLDVQTRNRKYTVPLPACGQHHRPIHRDFTEQQMRWQTNRMLQDLPEIMKKVEEKHRESSRQSNRLMAQRFNKKLQEFALRGKVSLRHTQKCL